MINKSSARTLEAFEAMEREREAMREAAWMIVHSATHIVSSVHINDYTSAKHLVATLEEATALMREHFDRFADIDPYTSKAKHAQL